MINPAAVQGQLRVRCARAGESWQPLGAPGRKRLWHYLGERGVPELIRQRYPVLADASARCGCPVVPLRSAHVCRALI